MNNLVTGYEEKEIKKIKEIYLKNSTENQLDVNNIENTLKVLFN